MNKISSLLVGVILLSVIFSFATVFTQVGTVGVSQGDWFKWSYSYTLSDEPTPPQFDIDWIKFLVSDISGTLITGESTITYNNGTEHTEISYIDVDNNDVTPIVEGMIISTHYSENDVVNNVQHLKIEEIVLKNFHTEPREMFHSTFTARSDVAFFDHDYYWDRETGILVDMSYYQEFPEDSTLGSGSGELEFKLIESNIPQIPEFPSWIMLPLFLTTTIIVLIYRKRMNRIGG